MRIAAAILFPCLLFGGLFAYARFLDALPKSENLDRSETEAKGIFRWEVTASCELAVDAFASDSNALELRSAGRTILARREPLPAGTNLSETSSEFAPTVGRNAVFVRAIPAGEAIHRAQALRVRIYRDDALLAEHTFWSTPGDPIAGEAVLDIGASTASPSQEHGS